MTEPSFPKLDANAIMATRDALHAYSRMLGDWLKAGRARRKHWWHASLRPSLTGLTTGVIFSNSNFEVELNMRESILCARTASGKHLLQALYGQPVEVLAVQLREFLQSASAITPDQIGPVEGVVAGDVRTFSDYSPDEAERMARALSDVTGAMVNFRAGIREESSPIQHWPHHFDLSMIWLPGQKIPDQDPADEEYADQQMNFGFVFGDEMISEPYFYVTAYPLPEAMMKTELPAKAQWKDDGFKGVVLLYRDLIALDNPESGLQELWNTLLVAGQDHLAHTEPMREQ